MLFATEEDSSPDSGGLAESSRLNAFLELWGLRSAKIVMVALIRVSLVSDCRSCSYFADIFGSRSSFATIIFFLITSSDNSAREQKQFPSVRSLNVIYLFQQFICEYVSTIGNPLLKLLASDLYHADLLVLEGTGNGFA